MTPEHFDVSLSPYECDILERRRWATAFWKDNPDAIRKKVIRLVRVNPDPGRMDRTPCYVPVDDSQKNGDE